MYLMYKVDTHYIHVYKIKDTRLWTAPCPKQPPQCVRVPFCPPHYACDLGTVADPSLTVGKAHCISLKLLQH